MAHFVDYDNAEAIISAIHNKGYAQCIRMKSDEVQGLVSLYDILQRMITEGSTHAYVPFLGCDLTNDWQIGYDPVDWADNGNAKFFYRRRSAGSDTWQEFGFCVKLKSKTVGGINGTFYPYIYFKNAHIFKLTINNQAKWIMSHDGLFVKNSVPDTYDTAVYMNSQTVCISNGQDEQYVEAGMEDLDISFVLTATNSIGNIGHNSNAGSFAYITGGNYIAEIGGTNASNKIIPDNNNGPYTPTINRSLPFIRKVLENIKHENYEWSGPYTKFNDSWTATSNTGVRNDEMMLPIWSGDAEIYV